LPSLGSKQNVQLLFKGSNKTIGANTAGCYY